MNTRIVFDVDRDGWTKNLQLNIVTLDENDHGMGFRLAGPKYNGSSTNLLRAELDDRDAAEIRAALDKAFPLPPSSSRAEVLREAAELGRELSRQGYSAQEIAKRLDRMADEAGAATT
ncbi:hypothetical protein AB0K87_01835 [Streptomyces sp. NPDC053705]|uniref:hypothetical protein n=1 Tax=Streptomyces TaxID=1883 RepID=UPI00341E0F05